MQKGCQILVRYQNLRHNVHSIHPRPSPYTWEGGWGDNFLISGVTRALRMIMSGGGEQNLDKCMFENYICLRWAKDKLR